MRARPPARIRLAHRYSGDHNSLKSSVRGPGPRSDGPGLRLPAPTLRGVRAAANLSRNDVDRFAFRRRHPRHRSVFECLSVSSQVRSSSPPPGWSMEAKIILTRGARYSGQPCRREFREDLAEHSNCLPPSLPDWQHYQGRDPLDLALPMVNATTVSRLSAVQGLEW